MSRTAWVSRSSRGNLLASRWLEPAETRLSPSWRYLAPTFALAALAALGLAACVDPAPEDEFGRAPGEEPPDVVEHDDFDWWWPTDLNVVEDEDPWATVPSVHECVNEDYLAIPEQAPEHASPIPEEELWELLDDIGSGQVEILSEPTDPDELADELREAMNVGFLLAGIGERRLNVTVLSDQIEDGLVVRELLFDDPYIGEMGVILASPTGPGPFPGVVAIHGHSETGWAYLDNYNGRQLAQAGYVVLMPSLRALEGTDCESETTIALLLQGFTMVAVRTYETALGLKYLRYLDKVDNTRIGLTGHSAGSTAGNLTIRVAPGFSAFVTDNEGTYYNVEYGPNLIDETAPRVYPYHPLVNDFETVSVPVLRVPYAHAAEQAGRQEITAFFDDWL